MYKYTIPETLQSSVIKLRNALRHGLNVNGALDSYIKQLDLLPARHNSQIEYEISQLAGLRPLPDGTLTHWLLWVTKPLGKSDKNLLSKYPRLGALFLMHPDGHLREASLRNLPELPQNPFLLAVVSLRMNDWVEPVRKAAITGLTQSLDTVTDAQFTHLLPFLLLGMNKWKRWKAEKNTFTHKLQSPHLQKRILFALKTSKTGPMARSLGVLVKNPAFDSLLPELAHDAEQPAVRAVATRILLTRKAGWLVGYKTRWLDKSLGQAQRMACYEYRDVSVCKDVHDKLIRDGAFDKSVVVRKIVADALIRLATDIGAHDKAYQKLLADTHPAIISRMGFLHGKLGEAAAAKTT